MMSAHRIAIALAGVGSMVLAMAGCRAPGKPGPGPEVIRPEQVLDFATLYKENCAGCHGENGLHGNAVSLANPVYLALADKDALWNATAKGGPGELMPAFAKSQGGTLTDQQIGILVDGMRQRWGRPGLLAGENPPPYAADAKGDAVAGQAAFATYCARCHQDPAGKAPAGAKGPAIQAGPVTDPNFLALISDQSLRSTILAGRPDEGMPDWRGFAAQPLTDRQVSDIVAWLDTQRQGPSSTPSARHP
jgi:cytochrome c oxidase cbb3-type subunit 3/ubiquinol-cytochrome c reductase cytochrome c subunit